MIGGEKRGVRRERRRRRTEVGYGGGSRGKRHGRRRRRTTRGSAGRRSAEFGLSQPRLLVADGFVLNCCGASVPLMPTLSSRRGQPLNGRFPRWKLPLLFFCLHVPSSLPFGSPHNYLQFFFFFPFFK